MPKAMQATTTGRRRLLSGLTALAGVPSSADLVDTAAAAPLAPPKPPHPDAELIALCARHPALIDTVNNSPIDFDKCPAWQAYEASRDAIHDARPVTLAGTRAKALAAKAEALRPDGTEDPDGTAAAHWAWDLVNDLLRLTGGAA